MAMLLCRGYGISNQRAFVTRPCSMYRIPISCHTTFKPLPLQRQLRHWARSTLVALTPRAWLSIQLVDSDASAALNHSFRAKNKPTNVLSFPLTIPVRQVLPVLGDLVLCPAVIWQEALDQEKTYHDHFAHIVIHGVLHLLGYDHLEPRDAAVMEDLEIRLLTEQGITNPYE